MSLSSSVLKGKPGENGETDLGPAVLRVESSERQEDRSRDLAEQIWKGLARG